ncbi:hypothetical protein ONZ45_g13178 [Pleurotus djamor]|nr:hypothetical protein ONZ45_g13178 [Pleurotus djamor]
MLDARIANFEPLNFSQFKYKAKPFPYADCSFEDLPEHAQIYLSSPTVKGRLLSDVRDERIEELLNTVEDTHIAIAGGLLQIHMPDERLEEQWARAIESVVYKNLKQEYMTTLDGFVEDFDALLWAGLANDEGLNGIRLGAAEIQEKRQRELDPYLADVYRRLLESWSQALAEYFARNGDY